MIDTSAWQTIDFISDLHLQVAEPATAKAWFDYMASADNNSADAIFILGDWFEVWVGDDDEDPFAALCAAVMRQRAKGNKGGKPCELFIMHGNRDFLFGPAAAVRCGMELLHDPVRFTLGKHTYLLSHGDALCLADTEYMAFRATVRGADWQQNFLVQPLAKRREMAAHMRAQSEARHVRQPANETADVDAQAATDWLAQAGCNTLIHGHTHRPAEHALPGGRTRVVLSDWDCCPQALTPRAEVLRLSQGGWRRVPLLSQ